MQTHNETWIDRQTDRQKRHKKPSESPELGQALNEEKLSVLSGAPRPGLHLVALWFQWGGSNNREDRG